MRTSTNGLEHECVEAQFPIKRSTARRAITRELVASHEIHDLPLAAVGVFRRRHRRYEKRSSKKGSCSSHDKFSLYITIFHYPKVS